VELLSIGETQLPISRKYREEVLGLFSSWFLRRCYFTPIVAWNCLFRFSFFVRRLFCYFSVDLMVLALSTLVIRIHFFFCHLNFVISIVGFVLNGFIYML
jgi:hypothetical protein